MSDILKPNGKEPTPLLDTIGPAKTRGKLSKEQVAHLEKLRTIMRDAETASERAFQAHLDAQKAYHAFLEEITAK